MYREYKGKPQLNLSVHDVTPAFRREIMYIDGVLDDLQIERTYAVVPMYLGLKENDLRKDLDLVEVLKKRHAEIILHGFTHCGFLGGSEFDCSYKEALARIKIGKTMMNELGLRVSGFVPPFWRLSSEALRALEDSDFDYVETANRIVDLRRHQTIRSLVCSYDLGSPVLNHVMHLLSAINGFCKIMRNDPIRVVIHPKDGRLALSQIAFLLRQLQRRGFCTAL